MAKQSAAAKRVAINTPLAALRVIRGLGAKNAAPFERLIHERVCTPGYRQRPGCQ